MTERWREPEEVPPSNGWYEVRINFPLGVEEREWKDGRFLIRWGDKRESAEAGWAHHWYAWRPIQPVTREMRSGWSGG